MFNETQVKILTRLMKSEKGLRYSEAYPGKEVDDDLYNYHLKALQQKGLVEKVDDKYYLSAEGRIEVQKIDAKGEVKDYYFRVSVLLYVINKDGKILLQKRTRYPLIGDVNTPSGKVIPGETFVEAAKRKLGEETGLVADFTFVGAFRSMRYDDFDYLVEDTIYHVCVAKKIEGNLQEKSEFGEFYWGTFEEYLEKQISYQSGSKVQEEVIRRVKNEEKEMFYLEEKLKLEKY